MVRTGSSDAFASWNTIAILRPRKDLIDLTSLRSIDMSSRANSSTAETELPGKRPSSASPRVLFPEPDSPTKAVRCPCGRLKDTLFTAFNSAPGTRY